MSYTVDRVGAPLDGQHQPAPPTRKFKPSQGNVPTNYYGDIAALKSIVGDEISELEKWTRAPEPAPKADDSGSDAQDAKQTIKFPETYDELIEIEIPDTNIGEGVDISGELQFTRLLRVDGIFRGSLASTGNIVVGKGGSITGDIMQIDTVVVNGGRIEGNLSVESLVVKNGGVIIGDISSKTLKVVGSDCYIKGKINVHSLAPEIIDENGDILFRSDGVVEDSAEDIDGGDESGGDDDMNSLDRFDPSEPRLAAGSRVVLNVNDNEEHIVAEVDPRKEKERIVAEKRAKKLALSKQVEDSFRSLQNNV